MLYCDLLIMGGFVVTLDRENRCFSGGAIAIKENKIYEIGKSDTLKEKYCAKNYFYAENKIIMPGFVNCHNHTPIILVRGMMEDIGAAPSYSEIVPNVNLLSKEETYHLARLGLYELLRFGSTTVVDSFHDPEPLVMAVKDSGLRGLVNGRIMDIDSDALRRNELVFQPKLGIEKLTNSLDFYNRWHGAENGRIGSFLALHAPNTCSTELLREACRIGEQSSVRFHIHLSQSQSEVDQIMSREGMTPTELLDMVGLLSNKLLAAHCLFLQDSDIDKLGKAKVSVCHSPIGNAKAGLIAPIIPLEKSGALITIGCDTSTGDMFESMRTAICLARIREGGGYEIKSTKALCWATSNGANALGLPNDIGSLQPGMKADIIFLDADSPNLVPSVNGTGIVVYSCQGSNVDSVMVDGQFVLRDKLPVFFDKDDVIREAKKVIRNLWSKQGFFQSQ